jgi:hypothetical protein
MAHQGAQPQRTGGLGQPDFHAYGFSGNEFSREHGGDATLTEIDGASGQGFGKAGA